MSATITDEDRAAIERGVDDLPEQHRAYVRALVLVAFLRGRVVEFERQHPNIGLAHAAVMPPVDEFAKPNVRAGE